MGDYQIERPRGSRTGYLFQGNFFDLVDFPKCEIDKNPTRTRQDFWREDIIPTAILTRQIYIAGMKDYDGFDLVAAWKWLHEVDDRKSQVKRW